MSKMSHCEEFSSVKINLKSNSTSLSPSGQLKSAPTWLQSPPRHPIKHASERNVILPFLGSLFSVTVVLVVGTPLMIITTVCILPMAMFIRFALNYLKLHCSTHYHSSTTASTSSLSANDAIWLHPNPFGANSAYSLLLFDKDLTTEKVKEIVQQRLVNVIQRGRFVYPRFRQRIIPLTIGYQWVDEENFDVDHHICSAPNGINDYMSLQSYLNELLNRPFELNQHSPWEIQVVMKYEETKDTVLIVRTHQSLSDAISLVRILTRGLSDNNSLFQNCYKPRCGGTTFPLNICRAMIIGPLTFLSWLLCTKCDYNFLNHKQPLSGQKIVAWSEDISLPKIVRIKQVSRSTLNDVILAALSGSLRNIFQSSGVACPKKLKANLSFDLRFESQNGKRPIRMGSKFALIHVPLPLHLEGCIPRLWSVRTAMDQIKSSADPVSMWGATALLETFLPQCLSRRLLGWVWSKASLTVNNIPGPEYSMYTMGTKLKSITCFVPPRDGIPLSVTITTNSKVLKLGVMVDKNTFADPSAIINGFIYQIEVMSKLLSSRRIPGEHRRKSSFIFDLHHLDTGPPTEEIQNRLHIVQKELHDIGLKLAEASSTFNNSLPDGQMPIVSPQEAILRFRISELKQEFSNLLVQLRRRKSVVQGVVLLDEELEEELDGELRKPRGRAVSIPSRKSSLTTLSTARPLTTPSTSYQSSMPTSSVLIDDYN